LGHTNPTNKLTMQGLSSPVHPSQPLNRRRFLQTTALLGGAAAFGLPGRLFADNATEELRVTLVASGAEDLVIYLPHGADAGVKWGCRDFSKDVFEATGRKLETVITLSGKHRLVLIPAVVDLAPVLAELEAKGKIDLSLVRGRWESYLIQPVCLTDDAESAVLVVAGSSPRAVAYGLYEISEKSFGTDPLKLWTDFVPEHKEAAFWSGTSYFPGPTVKYRGYLVNDEKYLLNWFTPDDHIVEPEIWARIYETAARTRANFVSLPDEYNKGYLDDASRVLLAERDMFLTGDHLQVMLVQTTSFPEFCKAQGFPAQWSWTTNKKALLAFWETKVAYNSRFKHNIWPIGLRAIVDMDISEVDHAVPKTTEALAEMMNEVIEAQCQLLAKYIPSKDIVTTFTMRGESLKIYQAGRLKLPDHCILVWCDAGSFARLDELPNAEEQKRSGGNGTYFHLTYCDNHFVQWVSPERIREQYLMATDQHKCLAYVMFNLGDLRELPLSIAAGLNIVWDVARWRAEKFDQVFTAKWIQQHFNLRAGSPGEAHILNVHNRYFTLESDMRCTSVLEVVRPVVWDSVKIKSNADLKKLLESTRFEAGDRFRVSEQKLKRDEQLWAALRVDAQSGLRFVPEKRQQSYKELVLLAAETSAAINRFAVGIRNAIDAALLGNKSNVVAACNAAQAAMLIIQEKRQDAMREEWKNWFRGDYYWHIKWSLRPAEHIAELEQFKKRLLDFDDSLAGENKNIKN